MRLVTIAKGELMTAESPLLPTTSFWTDALPLAPEDRVVVAWTIHYQYGPNTPTFNWMARTSNDGGANWVPVGTLQGVVGGLIAVPVTSFVTSPANGALIRFRTEFDVNGFATGGGAVKYDFHVLFDHA